MLISVYKFVDNQSPHPYGSRTRSGYTSCGAMRGKNLRAHERARKLFGRTSAL